MTKTKDPYAWAKTAEAKEAFTAEYIRRMQNHKDAMTQTTSGLKTVTVEWCKENYLPINWQQKAPMVLHKIRDGWMLTLGATAIRSARASAKENEARTFKTIDAAAATANECGAEKLVIQLGHKE
jgi:hypothetical protein